MSEQTANPTESKARTIEQRKATCYDLLRQREICQMQIAQLQQREQAITQELIVENTMLARAEQREAAAEARRREQEEAAQAVAEVQARVKAAMTE